MMDGLISRRLAIKTALEFFVEYFGGAFREDDQRLLTERIDALPSAQPERKTGRWISMTSNSNNYRCSVCGRMLVGITDGKNMVTKNYPYCHCGAKMMKDGEG